MKKIAIVTSHPIQYNAPWFAKLSTRAGISLKVFYTWGDNAVMEKYDPGFKRNITWDIPLLTGYEFEFLKNISSKPGSHHFSGIINPDIISKIETWDPQYILIFGWNFNSHLKVLRYFKGKRKILFRGDSTLLDEKYPLALKTIIRRFFLRWIYSYIDVALYTGVANKKYFAKHGISERQLIFAPHAVDNKRFYPDDDLTCQAYKWRQKQGIKESDIVFLFAGKLEEKKDPLLLIKAFKKLDLINTHLLIVGNGQLEDSVERECAGNKIHYMEFQNQQRMPWVYTIADVFVLPSKGPGETWGLAVNEAMANGKAIIVSDKCGCSADLIQHGGNGFIFKSGDEDDLLKKMICIKDKAAAETMGKQSLEIIKNWNYTAICDAVEQIMAE